MQTDYQIEELVLQNYDLVVYLAVDREQTPFALVRLRYPGQILKGLTDEVFENALSELQQLKHSRLRPVVDGGRDPVDRSPWIAARWWDGVVLTDRVKDSDLSPEELTRIQDNGQSLVNSLGTIAGAVSFTPASVVISEIGGRAVDTFSVDYHAWFSSFARGLHPATEFPTLERFHALLTYLKRHSQQTSAPLLTESPQGAPPRAVTPAGNVASPASAKPSSFPTRTILILATLLIGIGACLWAITDRKGSSDTPPVAGENTPPGPRPKRPRLDISYSKLNATDAASLKSHVGKWVEVSGDISELNSNDLLIFNNSSLRAALPPSSRTTAKNTINNAVSIQGFLESPTLLDVQDQADIEISYPLKEVYSAKDELQLRSMAGQSVTIESKILRYKPSASKKTFYLLFKNNRPEFAIAIQTSKAEKTLNEEYLKSLVGKALRVNGQLKIEPRGDRLTVVVTKKSQLEVVK